MIDKFWSEDLTILFKHNRVAEFFPSSDMSTSEKLNSVARFGIFLGVILALYKKQSKYFSICAFALMFTFFIYSFSLEESPETFDPLYEKCTESTPANPFMNVLPTDYVENPDRPKACDISDPEIAEIVNSNFEIGLFKNVNDPFDNKNSQRQFYTMPSTTIPNKQNEFAEWLFNGGDSDCKDTGNCKIAEDVRVIPPLLPYGDNNVTDSMTRFTLGNTRVASSKSKY
jgi:Family of unknown function (DUF5762)